jgi:signal transduction histidine kinase
MIDGPGQGRAVKTTFEVPGGAAGCQPRRGRERKMPPRVMPDDRAISLAKLPATPQQRRLVLVAAAALLLIFGAVAPFASQRLPQFNAFTPTIEGVLFVNELITSILLFAQFSLVRSRALVGLASSYLYTALIAIPHLLIFPGAFSPTGFFGAGPQSAAWLYYLWYIGSPVGVIVYALLKDRDHEDSFNQQSPFATIVWSMIVVVALVCSVTWLTTAGNRLLPPLVVGTGYTKTLLYVVNPAVMLLGVVALALLWARARSVLDYWLMIVVLGAFWEHLTASLSGGRFTVGFYASRVFSLSSSIVLLAMLLGETTRLYTRLARSNLLLQRERDNKLMNLEAMAAAISHEVKQPLTAIVGNGSAALAFLDKAPPAVGQAQGALSDIVVDGHRIAEALDGIRALFKAVDTGQEPVDVNEIALEALRSLRAELDQHGVIVQPELAPAMPAVQGNKSQLQQVIFNLAHNAIEAMSTTAHRNRVLRLITQCRARDAVVVTVQDSGPGIDPRQLDEIFDAFVTTKAHGRGLGLAISRLIAERHGGRLSARSDGASGALFQFILPLKSANDRTAGRQSCG